MGIDTHGYFGDSAHFLNRTPTGADLIAATRPFAKESLRRSWWCLLSTCVLLAVALAGTSWAFPLAVRLASSLLSSLLLMRLFVIYHDQQHNAILSGSRTADAMMKAFGVLALAPSSIWRSSHNHHHKHNSQIRGSHIGSFPIMTLDQFEHSSPAQRRTYLLARHPLTILFGYASMFLGGMCLLPFLRHPVRHLDCLFALIAHLAIGAGLLAFGGWSALVITLVGPFFVAYALGTYYFYAQHNFPGVSFSDKGGWTYEKAAMESSSFMRNGRIMDWFTANIGYHHIHHLNARIPFYRLPEVNACVADVRTANITSLSPRAVIGCLRLKVWDTERQRMIALP